MFFRNLDFFTTKDTKITKKRTEIIVKAFLRVLRDELSIKVGPQVEGAELTEFQEIAGCHG